MRIELSLACALLALLLPASASAVVGGRAVPSGGYPFVVAVGDARGPDCGGTLVAPDVVLTAAHCVAGAVSDAGGLRVIFGSHAIGGGQVARVASVYVHPGFSAGALHYDAALLILAQPAAGVPTVPLAASSPAAGSSVAAAGWGRTHEHGATSPGRLRSVALVIGTSAACAHGEAAARRYFAPSMLCASKPGRDTCAGDSGGPLVATSDGRLELVGITSFGLGCARSGHPGRYTRVSAIRGWALAQIAASGAATARLAALAGSGASPAPATAPA